MWHDTHVLHLKLYCREIHFFLFFTPLLPRGNGLTVLPLLCCNQIPHQMEHLQFHFFYFSPIWIDAAHRLTYEFGNIFRKFYIAVSTVNLLGWERIQKVARMWEHFKKVLYADGDLRWGNSYFRILFFR